MKKPRKNSEKVAETIATARTLSALVIEQETRSDISKNNLENITAVCELLVSNPHPVEPDYNNVIERGNVIYPRFPKRQTLKNRYRMLIAVWRGAYHDIVHLLSEQAMHQAMSQSFPAGKGSDAGTTIQALRAYIVRIRAENDQLRHELLASQAKLSVNQNVARQKQTVSGPLDGDLVG